MFARHLKRLTQEHKLSQGEIGELLGIDPRTYSRYLNPSDSRWPHPTKLYELAVFFEVSINDFFDPINTTVTRSKDEMRLLRVLRKSAQKYPYLPIEMISQALLWILSEMTPKDRNAWMAIGHQLRKARQSAKHTKPTSDD